LNLAEGKKREREREREREATRRFCRIADPSRWIISRQREKEPTFYIDSLLMDGRARREGARDKQTRSSEIRFEKSSRHPTRYSPVPFVRVGACFIAQSSQKRDLRSLDSLSRSFPPRGIISVAFASRSCKSLLRILHPSRRIRNTGEYGNWLLLPASLPSSLNLHRDIFFVCRYGASRVDTLSRAVGVRAISNLSFYFVILRYVTRRPSCIESLVIRRNRVPLRSPPCHELGSVPSRESIDPQIRPGASSRAGFMARLRFA